MADVELRLPHNGWAPRKHQQPLWQYLKAGGKRAIEVAHRRWGKDDVALHHTACAMWERPASYWHCLPEYGQARKAIWTSVNPHTGKRRIDEAFPIELRETTLENEMFIRMRNGATWQVIGSDRYDGLVGAGVAGVVFSEFALANPSSWGYIRPMVVENDGWALFITTPRGRNHAHSMYEMARADPRWHAEVSSVIQTKALTAEELEDSRREYVALYGPDIGGAQFEQEYLCSWNAAILGAFYAREMADVRSQGRIVDDAEADGDLPIHTAWDLGVRDSTAIWWWQLRPGGRLAILDYYAAHGAGLDHYAAVVHARGWSRAGTIDYVPHDARVKEWGTGRTRIEEMITTHGLTPVVVPRSSDADGHQAIRSTLPRCVFDARCSDGIAALESYRREWDDDLKTFKASALHDWSSHGAKAFQYLSQAWVLIDPAPPSSARPLYKQITDLTHDEWLDLDDKPDKPERI